MQLIRIRFPNDESKRRALGYLAGRFSFTSYATGEMLVIEPALAALASETIPFIVEGPVTRLSEAALADWNRPEEDAAWARLRSDT